MTDAARAEQVLVRRVVTGVCVFALLTVPAVHFGLGAFDSWISVAHLGVLVLAFGALGRGRVSLGGVVGGTGGLLLVVVLLGLGSNAAATFVGDSAGVSLGTGLLWLAAGMSPIVALVVSPRRGLVAGLLVLTAAVVVVVGAARWQWAEVARHPGVLQVLAEVAVVLLTTLVVAMLARRSADQRRLAVARQRAAAARLARLEAAQRQRAEVFTHTAARLRDPMDELVRSAADVHSAAPGALVAQAIRIEELADSMRDTVIAELDALAERMQVAGGSPHRDDEVPASATFGSVVTRFAQTPVLPAQLALVLSVAAIVVVDGLLVVRVVEAGLGDPHVVAVAANRMVTLLFVAVAVLVVRLHGWRGWVAAGVILLLHPVTALGGISTPFREALLAPYLSAWRMALVAAATLALLAEVIERRVAESEQLDRATITATARATAQARHENLFKRTYAEAAHELKNPLTVIGGAAGTIQRRAGQLTPEQLAGLRSSLVRAVDRLDHRLAAMGAAAEGRVPAGHAVEAPVVDRPAAVAGVVGRAVADAIEGVAPAPVVDLAGLDAATHVAPRALQHVVENLVGNATKHGDPATIRVRARDLGDQVELTVANRGGTLTQDEAARVFEPYFRAGGTDADVEGAGLGLAIVARLVEGWGGRCSATVDDGWTTVGVTLPTVPDPQSTADRLRPQPA